MRAIPNVRVLIPADTISVSKLTWIISQQYGPFYMRMARSETPVIHSESQEFEIGKGITLRDGSDCTIAACGITVEKAARETGGIVTCEEHNIMAGFGSAVAEVVSETYPVPIRRIGVQDKFGESARDNEISLLLEKHGITSINIAKKVKEIRSKS